MLININNGNSIHAKVIHENDITTNDNKRSRIMINEIVFFLKHNIFYGLRKKLTYSNDFIKLDGIKIITTERMNKLRENEIGIIEIIENKSNVAESLFIIYKFNDEERSFRFL
jgi:hypothetical protein